MQFKIRSYLKHHTGVIIKLERYHTKLVNSIFLSDEGNNSKVVSDYNYVIGTDVKTNKPFKGLTSDFKLIRN